MYIAQVTPRYHPYIGGVETVVKQISEEMIKQGHQVDVLTVDPLNNSPVIEDVNGVTVKRFSQNGVFYFSRSLVNYLKNNFHRYDIVHAHNLHTFVPHMALSSAKQIKGCKLVMTGHYHGRGKTRLSSLLLRLYRPFIKNFLAKAHAVTSVSHFEADLINKHFGVPAQKITVIPNGVSYDDLINAEPYDKTGICLLIVSRQEKYKNIHLVIQAMPYLPADFRLLIIGEGPYRHQLEKIAAKLNLGNRVNFLGRLKNEEVYRWYKTCDLVLNFSRLESFGLTVIEGLVAGKPVLINSSTALSELAELLKNVKAVEADRISPKEIANYIAQSVKMPCAKQNLSEYQWNNISLQYCNFYQWMVVNS